MPFDPETFTDYMPGFGTQAGAPVVFYYELKYFNSSDVLTTVSEYVVPEGSVQMSSSSVGGDAVRMYSEAAHEKARDIVSALVAGEFIDIDGVLVNRDRLYSIETKVLALKSDATSENFIPAY